MNTSEPVWFTSSYSSEEGGECVEVAIERDAVRIRDSKARGGGVLTLEPGVWAEFVRFAVGR